MVVMYGNKFEEIVLDFMGYGFFSLEYPSCKVKGGSRELLASGLMKARGLEIF